MDSCEVSNFFQCEKIKCACCLKSRQESIGRPFSRMSCVISDLIGERFSSVFSDRDSDLNRILFASADWTPSKYVQVCPSAWAIMASKIIVSILPILFKIASSNILCVDGFKQFQSCRSEYLSIFGSIFDPPSLRQSTHGRPWPQQQALPGPAQLNRPTAAFGST